ncbi:hypothetical protein ACFTZK_00710 [Streptomyces decoyicus]|uniref:hypothetical protein n=1 Tax=Streptomyces decoyicus TaxID=249567 RepID=UPI003645D0E9
MADEGSPKPATSVEIDDEGRIILSDPEITEKLKGIGPEVASLARRRRPVININCPCTV